MREKLFKILLAIIIIIMVIIPNVYWISNPELSSMQLLIKFWWLYLPGMAIAIGMHVWD